MRSQGAAVQEFASERKLQHGIQHIVRGKRAGCTEDHHRDLPGIRETDVFLLIRNRCGHAGQHTERGKIIPAAAPEEARQCHYQQDQEPVGIIRHLFFQQDGKPDRREADRPARQHVGGIMHADDEPADPDQQGQDDCQDPHPFFPDFPGNASVHAGRRRAVPAGK